MRRAQRTTKRGRTRQHSAPGVRWQLADGCGTSPARRWTAPTAGAAGGVEERAVAAVSALPPPPIRPHARPPTACAPLARHMRMPLVRTVRFRRMHTNAARRMPSECCDAHRHARGGLTVIARSATATAVCFFCLVRAAPTGGASSGGGYAARGPPRGAGGYGDRDGGRDAGERRGYGDREERGERQSTPRHCCRDGGASQPAIASAPLPCVPHADTVTPQIFVFCRRPPARRGGGGGPVARRRGRQVAPQGRAHRGPPPRGDARTLRQRG